MAERVPARGDAGKRPSPPAPVHFAFNPGAVPPECGERLRVTMDLEAITCAVCIRAVLAIVARWSRTIVSGAIGR